jgi:hypothetical protein
VTEPVRVGAVLPGVLAEVIDRAGPDYERWAEQVAATGYCAHPIRLAGSSRPTGQPASCARSTAPPTSRTGRC